MRADLREAIESARSVEHNKSLVMMRSATSLRRHSFDTARALVLAVVQELPSDMTAGEIAEELSIANSQGAR